MALGDVDENDDTSHQRKVVQDTAAMVFASISLSNTLLDHQTNQYHAAGVDSTVSSIHTFFLAMVCFPQIQMKAQAELDRIVSDRLPDFGDMEDLPYLSALVKEVLRSVASF